MDAICAQDMLTVLEYVDHFYATSWTHLLIYGSVAAGMVGIVMPILFQWFQFRTLQNERGIIRAAVMEQVLKEMHDCIADEKTLLEKKTAAANELVEERLKRDRADLEGGVRKLEEELRKEIERVTGGVLHVQTKMLLSNRNYGGAFESAVSCLDKNADADEHYNMRIAFKELNKRCLPNMTKALLDNMEDGKKEFDKVMAKIKEWDAKRDFSDEIKEAELALRAASTRGPAGSAPQL